MTDGERKIQYYVWEIEMADDFADHLRKIAAKEHMTFEEMTAKALTMIHSAFLKQDMSLMIKHYLEYPIMILFQRYAKSIA